MLTRTAFPGARRRARPAGVRPRLAGPDDRAARARSIRRARPTSSRPSTSRSRWRRRWRTCGRPAPATSSGASTPPTAPRPERWYIGRRHIEDDDHDPVVVDWRAPIAAPFYRATAADPLGVDLRRRFTLDEGELTAYLDEHLDDPDAADVAGGIPDPVLAEIGAERTGAMREIVATIQAEQDLVIRAADRPGARRAGRSGHRQDGRRPCTAPPTSCSSTAAGWPATACSSSARTGPSSTTSPTCCRRSASAACASARCSTCACRRSRSPASTTPTAARAEGGGGDARRAALARRWP